MPRGGPGGSRRKPRGLPRRGRASLTGDLIATGRMIGRGMSVLKGASSLFLNAEMKQHLVQVTATTSSSTPAMVLLSGISQGDTATTRDGNSIKIMSFCFRYALGLNASATNTVHRTIVFVDKRSNGADPTITDVAATAPEVSIPDLILQPDRFVILHDSAFDMNFAGNGGHQSGIIHVPEVAGAHVLYIGTGATIASIATGAIFVAHWSNEATNTPSFRFSSRIVYVDN